MGEGSSPRLVGDPDRTYLAASLSDATRRLNGSKRSPTEKDPSKAIVGRIDLEAATAGGFAAASRLDYGATAVTAAVVAAEQIPQSVEQVAAGSSVAASGLAAADRLANRFATANGLADRLTTANRLTNRSVAASVVTVEQTVQQATTRSGAKGLAAANGLNATNRLTDGLAAADRFANRLATTNRLATAVTGVTVAATEKRFQVPESAGILGLAGDERQSQNRRNEYTMHREVSMEIGQRVGFERTPSRRRRLGGR